jgi:TorA maturation chaperone TorD
MQEDTYEIHDDEFEGLNKEERQTVIEEHLREWAYNYIDWWWDEA